MHRAGGAGCVEDGLLVAVVVEPQQERSAVPGLEVHAREGAGPGGRRVDLDPQDGAAGSADALRDNNSPLAWELLTSDDTGWLRGEPGVTVREFGAGWALFESDEGTAQRVLQAAVARGTVVSFTRSRPTLAQIFTEVVK